MRSRFCYCVVCVSVAFRLPMVKSVNDGSNIYGVGSDVAAGVKSFGLSVLSGGLVVSGVVSSGLVITGGCVGGLVVGALVVGGLVVVTGLGAWVTPGGGGADGAPACN